MGRMKDTVTGGRVFVPWRGGRSGAGGRELVRVTEREPCPVCGRGKLCRVTTDGAEVWCSRVSDGAALTMTNDLGDVFVHRADGARRWEPPPAAPPVTAERAAPDDLDAVYRALLARLPLDACDRAALLARGLPAEHITSGMYRTLPERGRAALARELVTAVGEGIARRVPGIVWRTGDDGRGWWGLAGSPGLVIPVRDLAGRIVALKVRRRDPCDGARYLYVSSAKAGGPGPGTPVHVPAAALELRAAGRCLVITEGELKADVATALSGRPVVSVPGVGRWRAGVDLARAWFGFGFEAEQSRTQRARAWGGVVAVAFDADASTNPDVARHQRALLAALGAEGFDARLWQWPPAEGKGLDDFLLARRNARLTPMEPPSR